MKLTVEMNDEVADEFFRERLKDDYFMLCKEYNYLRSKDKLEPFQEEDKNMCFDNILALETLFRYYFTQEEYKELDEQGLAIRTGS